MHQYLSSPYIIRMVLFHLKVIHLHWLPELFDPDPFYPEFLILTVQYTVFLRKLPGFRPAFSFYIERVGLGGHDPFPTDPQMYQYIHFPLKGLEDFLRFLFPALYVLGVNPVSGPDILDLLQAIYRQYCCPRDKAGLHSGSQKFAPCLCRPVTDGCRGPSDGCPSGDPVERHTI